MTYVMTVDRAKHRVEIEFHSYGGDTDAFFADLKAAVVQAKGITTQFDIMTDFTKMQQISPVMPRGVADTSTDLNKWVVENGLRKSASIMGSALLKLQLQRVAETDKLAIFDNHDDAEAWLSEA
jgi:hypothetical protein